MSTRDQGSAQSERPFTDRHSGREFWSGIELPRWDDFSGARERFFSNLSLTAARYRGAGSDTPDTRPGGAEEAS